ncbi:hypothetical protein M758_1G158800 [Ceratodon purpureus]|uniref:Uncharacterized protein n=1 Tax=Ceratodon purpureus TaxID=3225 RepID=A0A8T0J6M3_CERPU|nr:hypothetical protein KC19_1G163100 [Ceratodon purpureus]KAG0630166.1 hypothetical protein M758_1G158800 [Ceratodon purpureus]
MLCVLPNISQIWFKSIQRVGVTNYLVVALDHETAKFCREYDVPVYKPGATNSKSHALVQSLSEGLPCREHDRRV